MLDMVGMCGVRDVGCKVLGAYGLYVHLYCLRHLIDGLYVKTFDTLIMNLRL